MRACVHALMLAARKTTQCAIVRQTQTLESLHLSLSCIRSMSPRAEAENTPARLETSAPKHGGKEPRVKNSGAPPERPLNKITHEHRNHSVNVRTRAWILQSGKWRRARRTKARGVQLRAMRLG